MPVITEPQQYNTEDLYVDLRSLFGRTLFLKCEGFNFSGSIKMKAALAMVEAAEDSGVLGSDSVFVESSSGNLGVALALVAASRGHRFLCVTDARCNRGALRMMEVLGSEVHVVTQADQSGGFLAARLDYVRRLCASDDRYVWLNQYTNPANWRAHYQVTAPAIAAQFPDLDVLFVGAGTAGTLMGCARYFREHAGRVVVVAVDAEGSVTFGEAPAPRHIPGLGASVRPPLLDDALIDDVVHVSEPETIAVCHRLASKGFVFGGSTGTVVGGALSWLAKHRAHRESTVVAIAPDLGERYLDSIYRGSWLAENYAAEAVHHLGSRAVAGAGTDLPLVGA